MSLFVILSCFNVTFFPFTYLSNLFLHRRGLQGLSHLPVIPLVPRLLCTSRRYRLLHNFFKRGLLTHGYHGVREGLSQSGPTDASWSTGPYSQKSSVQATMDSASGTGILCLCLPQSASNDASRKGKSAMKSNESMNCANQ